MAAPHRSAARRRRQKTVVAPYGGDEVVRLASPKNGMRDLYYGLLTTSRVSFAVRLIGVYLVLNLLFAMAYLAVGGIENARPGSFADAFFFSVQTMATIGYGKMSPVGVPANLLVTVEAAVGLFGVAVAAGLMFARFTRPTAGVRFSRQAVVTNFNGQPTLMFRLANERSDEIHEARIDLVLAEEETTDEGSRYRRLHDMSLLRSFTPVFGLSWTVMHTIDADSPLYGRTLEQLVEAQAGLFVLFSGHHEVFQQDVHARHAYMAEDIAWGMRFADLFRQLADGRRAIDYSCFDVVYPEEVSGVQVAKE